MSIKLDAEGLEAAYRAYDDACYETAVDRELVIIAITAWEAHKAEKLPVGEFDARISEEASKQWRNIRTAFEEMPNASLARDTYEAFIDWVLGEVAALKAQQGGA